MPFRQTLRPETISFKRSTPKHKRITNAEPHDERILCEQSEQSSSDKFARTPVFLKEILVIDVILPPFRGGLRWGFPLPSGRSCGGRFPPLGEVRWGASPPPRGDQKVSEFPLQKSHFKPLWLQNSEIKIPRPNLSDSRESCNGLKTSILSFLYIFGVFKMTHFTLQNGPFCLAECVILESKTTHFEV